MVASTSEGKKLVWALPKGSLNQEGRFVTHDLLVDAGFNIFGYEPGREEIQAFVEGYPWLVLYVDRPQNMPQNLHLREYDLAILGKDWVEEYKDLGDFAVELVDLNGGRVDIVAAIPGNHKAETLDEYIPEMHAKHKPIICHTEYVDHAYKMFDRSEAYRELYGGLKPSGFSRRMKHVGDNEMVYILTSQGQTESAILRGSMIVDSHQTCESLRRVGGKVIERVATSTARLYAGAHLKGPYADPWKKERVSEIARDVDGVVFARSHQYVTLNVHRDDYKNFMRFVETERVYADEPTVVPPVRDWHQVSMYIPDDKWIKIKNEMFRLGARTILPERKPQVIGVGERPYEKALD
ncbi:MAG: hypothetical protein HZB67_02695 [Candidatus Aenigmarchaeota archaeon]|nr:hypothetical protein [Candidatus Aenigmarchaeota archaeon]